MIAGNGSRGCTGIIDRELELDREWWECFRYSFTAAASAVTSSAVRSSLRTQNHRFLMRSGDGSDREKRE